MNIEFLGKFYDNHSLSIVNRNIALGLAKANIPVKLLSLDQYDPKYKVDKAIVKKLKQLELTEFTSPVDIQLRHSYPPMWRWPEDDNTKIVFIQPWEFNKVPFEWQYKFETFADALIVPSTYIANVFENGGLNPSNLYIVPNGYNDAIFNTDASQTDVSELGIDSSKFNFVYVGNAQWRKGLDLVLNAWPKVFRKYDNARLIIKDNPDVYGHNNTLNEVIKAQYKTECAKITYIDSNLSDEQMAAIFKASKVIVHPYRAEGFAMHVQEAVACGCLPIVSANGPTDDFLGKNNVGIRIPTSKRFINITDPGVFALKPGDATSLMSTHTYVEEPSLDYFEKALSYVYFSHNKEKLFSTIADAELNTWAEVTDKYIKTLFIIKNKSKLRRML
jgi:glycosyltransferase involved in cell wall biosynthesis